MAENLVEKKEPENWRKLRRYLECHTSVIDCEGCDFQGDDCPPQVFEGDDPIGAETTWAALKLFRKLERETLGFTIE